MDGFSKTDSDSDEDDEDVLGNIDEDSEAEILEGDEIMDFDPDEEALDTVDGPPLNQGPSRRKSSNFRKSSDGQTYSKLERRMSSPIGIRGGSVGPGGGRRLSNGLAASNMGQGTGGTSFT